MRSLAPALLALPLLIAGCVEPSVPADLGGAAPDLLVDLPVSVLDFSGHVLTSAGEGLLHQRATEEILWPFEQEGILAEIPEGVSALEVALAWKGPGRFMIMLHSDKGTNGYAEHITAMDGTNPKCLRVPAEDITAGAWQVMVHSSGAQQTDFTLSVLTQGGAAKQLDRRHGHELDEDNTIEKRKIEACSLWTAPQA